MNNRSYRQSPFLAKCARLMNRAQGDRDANAAGDDSRFAQKYDGDGLRVRPAAPIPSQEVVIDYYNVVKPDDPDAVFPNTTGPLNQRNTWDPLSNGSGDILLMKFRSPFVPNYYQEEILVNIPSMIWTSTIGVLGGTTMISMSPILNDYDPASVTYNTNPIGVNPIADSFPLVFVTAENGANDFTNEGNLPFQNFWKPQQFPLRQWAANILDTAGNIKVFGTTPEDFASGTAWLPTQHKAGQIFSATATDGTHLTLQTSFCFTDAEVGSNYAMFTAPNGGSRYFGLALFITTTAFQPNPDSPAEPFYGIGQVQALTQPVVCFTKRSIGFNG